MWNMKVVNTNLRIGIIGAGKTGSALAMALKKKGFAISGVYSRSFNSTELLGKMLGQQFENNLYSTVKDSGVIFITVPDSQISNVAANIINVISDEESVTTKVANKAIKVIDETDKYTGNSLDRKFFYHCSGSLTSEVLHELQMHGCHTGSLHPIQTFADRETGWDSLKGVYFGFEGSQEAELTARFIVSLLEANLLVIEKEMKPIYHAAACMLSNYTVALSFTAGELLKCAGIDMETGIRAFLPLLENTVENIRKFGYLQALTGPVTRGDYAVIEDHMKAIKKMQPGRLEVYSILGRTAVEIALSRGGINTDIADRLREIFKLTDEN